MAEIPTHLANDTQADVEPTAMSDHAPAAVGGPFATARQSPAGVAWPVLAVISAGGAAGALARYGLTEAFPSTTQGFAWATFGINVSGCLLIGVLMVVLLDVAAAPPKLARPFLGVGVLGGFTTFSTFALDTYSLIRTHRELAALSYLAASLVACLVAVTVAVAGSRRLLVRPR